MIEHQAGGWLSWAQAPLAYWALAGVGILALVGFAAWAFYGRAPRRVSTAGYHLLGLAALFLVVASLLVHVSVPASGYGSEPTQRAWDWQPGQALTDPGGSGIQGEPYRGYQVYISQGCIYCHTQYVRPQDIVTGWGQGLTQEDVSQAGDYTMFPAPLWGTGRNAPDLTTEGKRVPLMQWQIDHLKDPRQFQPKSIMPTYRHLSQGELADLAAFLVSLGNDPKALREGKVGPQKPPGISPQAEAGFKLAQEMGCLACHTTTGQASVGPTWKGLFGRHVELQDGASLMADEPYIEESIFSPQAKVVKGFQPVMPSFAGRLSKEQIALLTEYIKTLK